jgi:hypothetical protein
MSKRYLFLLATLGVFGCPGVAGHVPRPPTYENCVPSDPFYHDLAASTDDLSEPEEIPSNPHEALILAEQEIADNGISIEPKAQGMEDWSKFTTTFPDTIFVSVEFPDMDESERAEILWHELVHVRQYDRIGTKSFLLMYALAEGRWALEVAAYRESDRVWRLFGASEEDVQVRAARRADSLYDRYELGLMPRECAVSRAVEVWALDVR